MTTYMMKPVIVQAFQMIKEHHDSQEHWPEWLIDASKRPSVENNSLSKIATTWSLCNKQGLRFVGIGDWIVMARDGAMVVMTDEMFEAGFEEHV